MKILIVGMPGAGNLGDDLISSILVNEINKADFSRGKVHLGILSYECINLFGYNGAVEKLKYPVRRSFGEYFGRRNAIKSFLKDTDLIVIGGGGLIQDSHSYFTIHKYFKYLFYKESRVARVILLGVGVGPLNFSFTKKYLKLTSPRINTAFLRDEDSEMLGGSFFSRVVKTSDIVEGFNVASFGFVERSIRENVLGCSIRPWKGLDIGVIANLIAAICNKYSLCCTLFVFEYAEKNKEEYDFACSLKELLHQQDISVLVMTYGLDPIQSFIDDFCAVKKAVAIRFHANILWQKVGVPVLPISYAPKVASFYKKNGIEAVEILDVNKVDINESSFHHIRLHEEFDLNVMTQKCDSNASFRYIPLFVKIVSVFEHLYGFFYSIKIRLLGNGV